MKILIVEDDTFVADDLKGKLEHLDYRVMATAESYDEALTVIEKERPQLVLLDIELKGERTGIDLAKKLRHQGIPFIYLTGLRDLNTRQLAKDSRPERYLSKPIDLYNLRNAILDVDLTATEPSIHLIREKNGHKRHINPNNVVYVEAAHNCCDVYFADKTRVTLGVSMGEFVDELARPEIIRISRSYAINLNHILRLRGNEVEMTFGDPIRITDSYKELLHRHFKTY